MTATCRPQKLVAGRGYTRFRGPWPPTTDGPRAAAAERPCGRPARLRRSVSRRVDYVDRAFGSSLPGALELIPVVDDPDLFTLVPS